MRTLALSWAIFCWHSLDSNAHDAAILKCGFGPISELLCHKTVIYDDRQVDILDNSTPTIIRAVEFTRVMKWLGKIEL